MTSPKRDLQQKITERAAPALYGMWTAVGGFAGVLISAAAIFAAVRPETAGLALYVVIGAGLLAMLLSLASFHVHADMYSALLVINGFTPGADDAMMQSAQKAIDVAPKKIKHREHAMFLAILIQLLSFAFFSWPILEPPAQKPNKAPEPTPGPVTIRAERASEMSLSRKARLAPGPVVAHL